MTLERLRLIDIMEMDEELLVQEIINDKVRSAPPTGEVYRGDVPDITTPEQEAEWQKTMDERARKATAPEVELPNADKIELPPEATTEETSSSGPVELSEPTTSAPVTVTPPADTTTPPAPEKHVITQADLDTQPGLIAEGYKVGDEIDVPTVTGDTKDDSAQRFCDFCDSKGGFHKKDCPTRTVGQ